MRHEAESSSREIYRSPASRPNRFSGTGLTNFPKRLQAEGHAWIGIEQRRYGGRADPGVRHTRKVSSAFWRRGSRAACAALAPGLAPAAGVLVRADHFACGTVHANPALLQPDRTLAGLLDEPPTPPNEPRIESSPLPSKACYAILAGVIVVSFAGTLHKTPNLRPIAVAPTPLPPNVTHPLPRIRLNMEAR